MEIYEIVKKLIGNTEPIGCSNEDANRLENLKELIKLSNMLNNDIVYLARYIH